MKVGQASSLSFSTRQAGSLSHLLPYGANRRCDPRWQKKQNDFNLFGRTIIHFAGINHFINTDFYVNVMPPYIPAQLTMVYVSGFFEVVDGAGDLIPRLRRAAGWGLIAFRIAVFPVHLHMAKNPLNYSAIPFWAIATPS